MTSRSILPVLLPPDRRATTLDPIGTCRQLAAVPSWLVMAALAVLALAPLAAHAADRFGTVEAFAALWRWMPYLLLHGFLFNIVISCLCMLLGTAVGVFLGLGQVSQAWAVRRGSWLVTQLFRNSPWLVLLFIVMLAFPFEIRVAGVTIPVPDWVKAVIGLALPVMANIAEIVRGAIRSVPDGQWEAAESLAFSRRQILWRIILPQCIKRMIPPWMNWYAILTMATPLCSILGVDELVNLIRQAIAAENNRPELLVPFYGFALTAFFLYCYPIARVTVALERRFNVRY